MNPVPGLHLCFRGVCGKPFLSSPQRAKLYCSRLCKTKDGSQRHEKRFPERARQRSRAFEARHPNRSKHYMLKHHYGLTRNEFDAILKGQNNLCKLCQLPFATDEMPHVDHDHKTKKVRGLLHRKCNIAIGMFNDDSALCRLAADYLESFNVMDL